MKVIASTDEYTIYQRRDGRHAVKGADKQPINGDAKVEILLRHELVSAPPPKAPEPEPPAAEPAAEAEGEEAGGESEAEGGEGGAEGAAEEAGEEQD